MQINRLNNIDHLTKYYYSISEVAMELDVSTSLLRYWEKEFPKLKPKKSRRGDRQYTKKDIELLVEIKELVKVKGYTLDGAKKNLKNKAQDSSKKKDVIKKLIELRQSLLDLKSKL